MVATIWIMLAGSGGRHSDGK